MYEMYTDEGDMAVARALAAIDVVSSDRTVVWNRTTLEAVAAPVLQAVAKLYGEIYDTEPRGHIARFLDQLCAENGWAYNEFESYDW